MSVKYDTTEFNSNKLRKFLDEHDMSQTDLSKLIRKERSFTSHAICEGKMNSTAYELMCFKLGVDFEYFLVETEETEETEETNNNNNELLAEIIELLKENNTLMKECINMWRYE